MVDSSLASAPQARSSILKISHDKHEIVFALQLSQFTKDVVYRKHAAQNLKMPLSIWLWGEKHMQEPFLYGVDATRMLKGLWESVVQNDLQRDGGMWAIEISVNRAVSGPPSGPSPF